MSNTTYDRRSALRSILRASAASVAAAAGVTSAAAAPKPPDLETRIAATCAEWLRDIGVPEYEITRRLASDPYNLGVELLRRWIARKDDAAGESWH